MIPSTGILSYVNKVTDQVRGSKQNFSMVSVSFRVSCVLVMGCDVEL